jgi:peptidoglycan/xylan/chitin deacetylase (PgdA/CDA1 family)
MRRAPDAEPFCVAGFPRAAYFPHDTVWVTKHYPDALLQLARRGVPRAIVEGGRGFQLNLYSDALDGLPDALFTDRAVNWHGQQLGRRGLVAAAGLFLERRGLFVTLLQSDLCQQIFRHPSLKATSKTRLDSRFRSWPSMLLNAVLDFAAAQDIDTLYSPTSDQILSGIRRPVDPTLFRRIYDAPLQRYLCRRADLGAASYWALPLRDNRDRFVRLVPAGPASTAKAGKAIGLFHDIEENVSVPVGRAACRASLTRMLETEARHGVHATYNVVGTLLQEKRAAITVREHAVGLHSYNHLIHEPDQLRRAREVDLQVRGYRPPQSVLTTELSDYNLSYFNFEWLLTSALRFGFDECRLEGGIAKIPVHLDDHPLHTGEVDYAGWRARLRRLLDARDLVVVGLHDCYAHHWLDRYDDLLAELRAEGDIVTCDGLADRMFLASDRSHAV